MSKPHQVQKVVAYWACCNCQRRFLTEERAAQCIARHARAAARSARPDRNTSIVERRIKGESLASIASDFGISRERVRQIVARQDRIRKRREFDRLSTRSANCLRAAGMYSMDEVRAFVLKHGDAALLRIENFGSVSMIEVRSALALVPCNGVDQ